MRRAALGLAILTLIFCQGCYDQPTLQQREASIRAANDRTLRNTAHQLQLNTVTIHAVRSPQVRDVARTNQPIRATGSTASGAILTEDGYILTAAHCIDAPTLLVTIPGQNRRVVGRVVWRGNRNNRLADLALIKIDADDLIPLHWADTKELRNGGRIAIAGASVKSPQAPVTVMAGQIIQRPSSNAPTGPLGSKMLGAYAPAGKGDSGGPVVNRDGKLVGIVRSQRAAPFVEPNIYVLRPDARQVARLIERDRLRHAVASAAE